MGANRVTLRGRFVELRALASSSRGIDGSTGNVTLIYLSNEPKSDRNRLGLPELGLDPGSLNPYLFMYSGVGAGAGATKWHRQCGLSCWHTLLPARSHRLSCRVYGIDNIHAPTQRVYGERPTRQFTLSIHDRSLKSTAASGARTRGAHCLQLL